MSQKEKSTIGTFHHESGGHLRFIWTECWAMLSILLLRKITPADNWSINVLRWFTGLPLCRLVLAGVKFLAWTKAVYCGKNLFGSVFLSHYKFHEIPLFTAQDDRLFCQSWVSKMSLIFINTASELKKKKTNCQYEEKYSLIKRKIS